MSYYVDFITEKEGMLYSNTSYKPRYSAAYTFKGAAPYDNDTEEPDDAWNYDAPWDTGRASVWLMPMDECDCGQVVYTGNDRRPVMDTKDLWSSGSRRVYEIDHDSAIAYRQDNMTCTKAP